jgi:hypothetical protein
MLCRRKRLRKFRLYQRTDPAFGGAYGFTSMHQDAIGAFAEEIASIGVTISLDYRGIQIQSQTAEPKLVTGNELTNQLNNICATNSDNAELAEF